MAIFYGSPFDVQLPCSLCFGCHLCQGSRGSYCGGPFDHRVADTKSFETAIQSGIDHLEHANDLITLGIQPQNPNTGYGYIQYDSADQEVHLNRSVFDVRRLPKSLMKKQQNVFYLPVNFYGLRALL